MIAIGGIDFDVGDNNDVEDDDDDLLGLFSFGADTPTPMDPNNPTHKESKDQKFSNPSSTKNIDRASGSLTMNIFATDSINDDDNNSYSSNDSFIDMLGNARQNKFSVFENLSGNAIVRNEENEKLSAMAGKNKKIGPDMHEIMNWFKNDDQKENELLIMQEEKRSSLQRPCSTSLLTSVPKPGAITHPLQNEEFSSVEDAIMSKRSTKIDITRLLERGNFTVGQEIRPHLWAKIICGKTVQETLQSDLAGSFQQWELDESRCSTNDYKSDISTEITPIESKETPNANNSSSKEERKDKEKSLQHDSNCNDQISQQKLLANRREQQRERLEKEADYLVKRILVVVKDGKYEFSYKALQAILKMYLTTPSECISNKDDSHLKDPLVPPVVCTILSSGVPPQVAYVMLKQIIPSFMPILALTSKERQEASIILHHQLYLLATYHLPLLVLHLDKFIPGWHTCHPNGKIPQSWLISYFAGETEGTFVNVELLIRLWDSILSSDKGSFQFFLVLAVLAHHAESLLLLSDDHLKDAFSNILNFSWSLNSDRTAISEVPISDQQRRNGMVVERVQEWVDKSTLLWEDTPISSIQNLKSLEDEIVTNSLVAREEAKEEMLRRQQEAEEKAVQEAREIEKERKADEARTRLNRARLVAFYRQYNPGKEDNVDKIMKSYEGRYEVLDTKLRLKYGVGFNPALKPKPILIHKNKKKIFSTMNSGFHQFKSKSKNRKHQHDNLQRGMIKNLVIQIPPSEVLPAIYLSKDSNRMRSSKIIKHPRIMNGRVPLKFCIVDCRLATSTKGQGRLPASINFSLQSLIGPNNKEEEKFEYLRGSAHICILSEGYTALPQLYGHKMTSELSELIREEEDRKTKCTRFFVSKGFPFVSIMEGGFASAHAYLCRDGPKHDLNANDVLIDYDPEESLFGRFENLRSMSSRDKAQRSLQNLFDSSMAALTKHSIRLESLTSDFDNGSLDEQMHQKDGPKYAVQRFFRREK